MDVNASPQEADSATVLSPVSTALKRARRAIEASQKPDGTWSSPVRSDLRVSAFYLNTIRHLGRQPDAHTKGLESHMRAEQLSCGGWEAWPGGGPDLDVTAVCALALETAATPQGQEAREQAQDWLCQQPLPEVDAFWLGYLAQNGDLGWDEIPYVTPRLISAPAWVHPNIHDFSFMRLALVTTALMQSQPAKTVASPCTPPGHAAFLAWRTSWIAAARSPQKGLVPSLTRGLRHLDRRLPLARHRQAALDWLLAHQEADGSFFSSVHMTSTAILTLHKLDPLRFRDRIDSGLRAMQDWQQDTRNGRVQAFTDSTTWDTILSFDLLNRLGARPDAPAVIRARSYLRHAHNDRPGDWRYRVKRPAPGAWGFQRTGQHYPDCDDTALAVTTLMETPSTNPAEAAQIRNAVEWLLSMQGRDGGWASWDRNDRAWVRHLRGGRWIARDVACPAITSRNIIVMSRVARGIYPDLDDLAPTARRAVDAGIRWLERNARHGIWLGVWFAHYLYGTSHALEAFAEVGLHPDDRRMQVPRDWLLSQVNDDGGFGEAPNSAITEIFVSAPSTPFHTACALMGLISAGAADHPVTHGAVRWLLDHQDADGLWRNPDFFAAGVPGLWYANFAFTPAYYAAKSLCLYRHHIAGRHT